MHFLSNHLGRWMRVRQWWSSKLPMYMALSAWLCLSAGTQPDLFFSRLALVVFWVMVTASAGYLINNYFDYEDDLRAGKAIPGQRLSAAQFILLLVVLLALSTATVAILPGYPYNLLLQVAEIGIFFAYAAPPLRLKQLPVAGLISDALYAFVIPSLIVLLSFSVNHLAAFIPWLVLWSLAAGLRNIISHHLADRKADHRAGVFNFANFAGIKTAITLHHSLLAAEIPLFILLLLHGLHAYWLIAAAAVVIMLKLFTTDRYGIHFFRRALIKNLQTGVNDFYEGWWLFFSTVLLTAKQGWFSLLLPIQFLMFSSFASIVMQLMIKYVYYQLLVRIIIYRFFIHFLYHRLIVGVLYYGILVNLWHHGILRFLYFIYSLASLTVNYSIYYYRRYVLKQDDATARRLYVKNSDSPTPAQPHKSDIHAIQDEKETAAAPTVQRRTPRPAPLPLLDDNKIINGLWIGNRLSRIELLTILSFIAQGHTFRLWVYDRIATPLPSHGLQLADATSIIPAAEVFSYRKANKYGHGKGSYGGFSDIFRYKLLYEHGGWWVDMDVTCLKPLNFPEPYFFRPHHELPMVGNVMKCPKGSALMLACYEQAKKEVTEENTDWHKPIEILNHYVLHYQLQEYIFNPISNEDKWSDLKKLIGRDVPVPSHYFVIHWMNEEWRSRKIDKNDVRYGGVLGKLMQQYGLLEVPSSRWRLFTHNFRHSVWIPVYENLLKT